MSGGIAWLTLPAGYLGSGLIGAALIACGFDTNASKIACLVLAAFFIFTLWWARRNLLCVRSSFLEWWVRLKTFWGARNRTWALLLGMSGLIILFWFLEGGEALRYLVSSFSYLLTAPVAHRVVLGAVHRRHVVLVRPLGCHR
jgi:hypothetical protein